MAPGAMIDGRGLDRVGDAAAIIGGPADARAVAEEESRMSCDLAAVLLALRWYDEPRAAAVCGCASTLCSFVGARRSRAREHATADAD